MIAALNYKPFTRGSIMGFFDLRYHGLTIKGARLMDGQKGMWIGLPQRQGEKDGETKYFDQMYLTSPEMEHVRYQVIADLQAQGYIEKPSKGHQRANSKRQPRQQRQPQGQYVSPEGEDLSEYYTDNKDDGIAF